VAERPSPTGNIVPSEQVTENYNKQPEPDDKCEYCDHIRQEIWKREAALEEQRESPLSAQSQMPDASILLRQ